MKERKKKEEILYKQLELLAEDSKAATDNELANMSVAMVKIYEALLPTRIRTFLSLYFFIALANLIVSLLILIC